MADESASSKLDSLSKEELVKLIKKYMILQKQMKIKNQELCNKLEAAADTTKTGTISENETKIKELEETNEELRKSNDQLTIENSQLKFHIDTLTKDIAAYKTTVDEVFPQLENARQEISLNKSMLDILNNEIQMLNSDKILLEKRLFNTRRNVTPSIIVEEDEDDLEEEKRNEHTYINDPSDTYESYEEHSQLAVDRHNHDVTLLRNGPTTNDGILILNKQIEDLTFYCDELKSELEAEREKNNELIAEIKACRVQIEDFEQQHEFNSLESSTINECLKKSQSETLVLLAEKEDVIRSLERRLVNPDSENEGLNRFLTVLCDEILEKKNYAALNADSGLVGVFDLEKANSVVEKVREISRFHEERLSKEMVKGFEAHKNFEAQMERVVRDFREEISGYEERLNGKQAELNEMKLKADVEIKTLKDELANEKTKSKDTLKEISKNKILDLELADYERSIKALSVQAVNRERQIEELTRTMGELKAEKERLVRDKESSEEKCTKLKHLLIKAKKEVADAKEHEHQHLSSDVQLKAQIEAFNIEIETYKVSLAGSEAAVLKMKERMDRMQDASSQEIGGLEVRLKCAEEARDDMGGQLARLRKEYEEYKIKVQHAFRKQKESAESGGSESEVDVNMVREKAEKLAGRVEEERIKVAELERENEGLREEFTKSLQRNTKLLGDLKEKETEWRIKSEDMVKSSLKQSSKAEETIQNLRIELEAVTLNFKEKIRQFDTESSQKFQELQSQIVEYKQSIDDVNKQLAEVKEKNVQLEQSLAAEKNQSNNAGSLNVSVTSNSSNSKEGNLPQKSFDLSNNFILRQVENIDRSLDENKQASNKTIEELLNESPLSSSITSNHQNQSSQHQQESKLLIQQIELLRTDMDKGKLQLSHLNELLNESESTNSRLSDQINVLKDEIRRLERNQEREKSIANMEYLKNVVYKFLTFTNSEEKTQLLPVLSTMLKLSPAEQAAIMNTKASEGSGSAASEGGGWSMYLPKWT